MKGGITSGVVYPLAAVELAETHGYEFRNIGGTSAGAIAAAAVAAAECGRRTKRNKESYDRIKRLPKDLGKKLTSLFQPSPRMRPLFNVLLFVIDKKNRGKRLGGLLKAIGGPLVGGALPGLGLLALAIALNGGWPLHVLAGLLAACVALAGAILAVAWEGALLVRELPQYHFGLCPGNDRDEDAKTPPLTRWLSSLIDELAGKPEGEPLTFGDLWWLGPEPDGASSSCPFEKRQVNLQMMTTNLSQGRPYSLPFEAGEVFWFDANELLDFFPRAVVDHMVASSSGTATGAQGALLHELPCSKDLPVVFAARLSLSFPALIAAVPLYAINHPLEGEVCTQPERCWFSDGGITSNFPVHFFDSPVPRWPTFGLDLAQLSPGEMPSNRQSDNVWLPKTNGEGMAESWVGWEHTSGFKRLGKFATSIFRTAQNWIDNRQMRGAGYRDRIAHVLLGDGEGGLNLTMDAEEIKGLAERGGAAAAELAKRFGPEPPDGTQLTWDNQRWVRYRAYMELLERKGHEARRGSFCQTQGAGLEELREDPPSYPFSEGEGRLDGEADELVAEFGAWTGEERFSDGAPPPRTEPWSIPRV